jgi:hypothetical protein
MSSPATRDPGLGLTVLYVVGAALSVWVHGRVSDGWRSRRETIFRQERGEGRGRGLTCEECAVEVGGGGVLRMELGGWRLEIGDGACTEYGKGWAAAGEGGRDGFIWKGWFRPGLVYSYSTFFLYLHSIRAKETYQPRKTQHRAPTAGRRAIHPFGIHRRLRMSTSSTGARLPYNVVLRFS